MEPVPENKTKAPHDGRIVAGIILILLGAAALLQHWFDIGNTIVLLLGLGILTWGSVSRRTGLIIPGGVLTGIGLGILAMQGPWQFPAVDQNSIFLLCFALGWFLITLLTALFASTQWWALIPGGIMALIGGSLLIANGTVRWMDINLVMAVILIVLGLALLVYRGSAKEKA
ncbi:MAG: hypothetical protein WCE68_05190 [Anaerolineales bacterium]